MIVTFYSYKGGVGRSMALANVGEYFARRGILVIMIDWDLEAPGLERYFPVPREDVEALPGVIDLLFEYREAMAQPPPSDVAPSSSGTGLPQDTKGPPDSDNHVGQQFGFHSPREYLFDLGKSLDLPEGRLLLLPAGQRNGEQFASYASRVQGFDWAGFYREWEGEAYLEWFRKELDADDVLVLVDSRTGVTEIGGVCVYQLADVVVMLCAANQTNLEGTQQMAAAFNRPRVESLRGGRKLSILPVPARIPKVEEVQEINSFLNDFADSMGKYYLSLGLTPEASARQFMIPQIPLYSFRERVAIRETGRSPYRNDDLTRVYSDIARTLASLAKPGSALAQLGVKSGRSPIEFRARPTIFIIYSHQDKAWKDRLVRHLRVLELEGDLVIWDDRRIDTSEDWLHEMDAALAHARAAVLLISVDFLTSRFIRGTEVPELLRRRQSEEVLVIPVIVHPCPWTAVAWLSTIQCRPKDGRPLSSKTESRIETELSHLALEVRDVLFPKPKRVLAASPAPRARNEEGILHNLPYSPLDNLFTGRQEELDVLAGGETTAIMQSVVISGLGGIGKTRLAVEYAWRSFKRYTAVWFVRADSPENLRRNLAALASPELLNLPEWEAQVEEKTVAAVKRWFRENSGWLMILDNVDTPEAADAALEILPSLSDGRVLITSRLTTWPARVSKQQLDKLSPEEAIRFLLHRTEGEREPASDDALRAADLAERVDGLPLALEQAAAYIIRHRMRFADYLRAWEQEQDKLLQWYDPRMMQYSASLAVTWKQTVNRLSPTAVALLRLTAFLAPDQIPFEMLEQEAEHVQRAAELFCEEAGTAADGKTIREAAADLADYSLITRQDGGMLLVHRMVQEALRSQIPEEHRRDWIEVALRIVDDAAAGDPGDVRTWPLWDRLRPHAAKIVATADEADISNPTSRLMNELGHYLHAKALYFEAEPLMRRALAIDEAALGDGHPRIAVQLNNLAQLLKDTNRLEEAEPLIRRALDIDRASFGGEHPNVSRDLNNLAQLLQDTNRLEEAEPLMRQALKITEFSFGNEHPEIARDLNNLAQLLQDTNRLEEAEPLMRRALAIDEVSFGNEHPEIARDLNNLAALLQATNRLEEAEPLMRRALAIDVDSFGNDHPEVAIDLNNLGQLFQATNRLEEAEPLMRRAVAIWEMSLGSDHPKTQLGRRNLEILLSGIGKDAEGGLRGSLDGKQGESSRATGVLHR